MPPKPVIIIDQGPSCMIGKLFPLNALANPSEDCLGLNVVIPASARPGDNLPVLVYVFGTGN
jgi:carboxylesterase type B